MAGISSSISKAVGDRAKVGDLVATDIDKALEIARNITEPWYKTQSLSTVAENIKNKKAQLLIVQEAFDSALGCKELNRIVSVSIWPLGVLLKMGIKEKVHEESQRLLQMIKNEPHPVRRGDAQASVMYVLSVGAREDFLCAFYDFIDTCKQASKSWRLDDICRRFAPDLQKLDPKLTPLLLDCIRMPKVRRLAERDIKRSLK